MENMKLIGDLLPNFDNQSVEMKRQQIGTPSMPVTSEHSPSNPNQKEDAILLDLEDDKNCDYIRKSKIILPENYTKSNELCEAKLEMQNNALSNKIFCLLIASIDPKAYPYVSVSAIGLFNYDIGGKDHENLKKACHLLSKAQVTKVIFNKKGNEVGFSFSNIFQDVKYIDGVINGIFNDAMKPLLLDLREKYTILNLSTLLSFSSFYSQRIYEILLKNKYLGQVELNLEDLQNIVNFPQASRNDFAKFRKNVLEQAKWEIEKFSNLQFDYFIIKSPGRGGKIIAIKFVIGDGKLDQRYVKTNNNFLFQPEDTEYELWLFNNLSLVSHNKKILTEYTSSQKLISYFAAQASIKCFNLRKFIDYCKDKYNTNSKITKGSSKAYIIASLKNEFNYKTIVASKYESKKDIIDKFVSNKSHRLNEFIDENLKSVFIDLNGNKHSIILEDGTYYMKQVDNIAMLHISDAFKAFSENKLKILSSNQLDVD
jgi:plasmid replication initiation protein